MEMKLISHSIIFISSPVSPLPPSPPPKNLFFLPFPSPSGYPPPHPLGYLAAPQAHSPDCFALIQFLSHWARANIFAIKLKIPVTVSWNKNVQTSEKTTTGKQLRSSLAVNKWADHSCPSFQILLPSLYILLQSL